MGAMSFIFHTFFYEPLYNGLVFLMDLLPWIDVGTAVILFTIIVKFILFPLSKTAIVTQLKMKQLEEPLNKIKEKFKNSREEQTRAIMSFYKENKVNPFSTFAVMLIQIPIILGLYWVFYKGGFPDINTSILYSFVKAPAAADIDMNFLGLVNIGGKSAVLALIVGITQFFQMRFSVPPPPPKKEGAISFKDELARNMGVQMRYVFPFVAAFFAWSISGAIALYWTTSNLFAIAQELYIRKHLRPSFNKEALINQNGPRKDQKYNRGNS